jgi:COP9 signalosome complex subunit 4
VLYQHNEDNFNAAKILERINLENVNRQVTEDEKADVYIMTAEAWFEEEDAVNAEKYINKAAHIMHLVKNGDT